MRTGGHMPYSMLKAAKVAGVSKTTMHKWVKSGKFTSIRLDDGTYSIDESELNRVIQSRQQLTSTTVTSDVNKGNTPPQASTARLEHIQSKHHKRGEVGRCT